MALSARPRDGVGFNWRYNSRGSFAHVEWRSSMNERGKDSATKIVLAVRIDMSGD
jgi:hypothetical protein